MITLKRPPAHTGNLALWTWIAVALTPLGWFYGFLAIAYSHLGDVTDVGTMTTGVVLFVEAPVFAVVLAVYAARAGHRSGRIAVVVSGLLLLATLVFLTLVYWWVGVPVTGVVAVLVFAGVCSRRIAVAVFGSLLLVTLSFMIVPWWIGKVVTAVIAVPVFFWVRSRSKPPPPGPDSVPHEEGPPPVTAPPGASGRTTFIQPGPIKPHPAHASSTAWYLCPAALNSLITRYGELHVTGSEGGGAAAMRPAYPAWPASVCAGTT